MSPMISARPTLVTGFGATALLAGLCAGCGAEAPIQDRDQSGDPRPLADRITDIQRELGPGAEGTDVQALNLYLKRYGYFPNEELARRYPSWRPIVEPGPAIDTVFDDQTELAVRALQQYAGVTPTGIADERTLARLRAPRCGTPDGIAPLDPSNKFAVGSKWNTASLTWRLLNSVGTIAIADARREIAAAAATWTAETNLTLTQLSSGTADIMIQFAPDDGPSNELGWASGPPYGDITLDNTEAWSVAPAPAPSVVDLQSLVFHELGHALGLQHSGFNFAMMWPWYEGGFKRTPDVDDKVAISVLYDTWQQVSSAVEVAGNGDYLWALGPEAGFGGYAIKQRSGNSWITANGVATKIAVTSTGVPWVIAPGGGIYRRTSSSASTGSWQQMPGCATDIAIGYNNVWSLGCSQAFGGYAINQWNGSAWIPADGVAIAIAVGPSDVPWVIAPGNAVFRRTTGSATTGSWQQLSGVTATDIAVDVGGNGWIVGTNAVSGGFGVYVYDEQPEILYPQGGVAAPLRNQWLSMAGIGGVRIGAGNMPWVVNNTNGLLRSVK